MPALNNQRTETNMSLFFGGGVTSLFRLLCPILFYNSENVKIVKRGQQKVCQQM